MKRDYDDEVLLSFNYADVVDECYVLNRNTWRSNLILLLYTGSMDAGNLLKPMLARGELRCIGATTLKEYKMHIEKDKALERRFQQVIVAQPTVVDTISILRGLKEKYEIHHGVRITDAALVAAATLSHRYISERFLPDKAIDLVDEAAAKLNIELTSKPQAIDELDRRIIQLQMGKNWRLHNTLLTHFMHIA